LVFQSRLYNNLSLLSHGTPRKIREKKI